MCESLADGFFAGKRALICGPGYVGGAVAQALLRAGAEVAVLARSQATVERCGARGCAGWAADVAAADWHDQHPASYDFILYAVSSGGGGLDNYRRCYVDGMKSLQSWLKTSDRSPHVVYTSSTSVYAGDGGEEVDETGALETTEPRAATLIAAEAELGKCGHPWTILRVAGIYGPGRHYLLDQLRASEVAVAGRGDVHLNLAHRDDIVGAILAAWHQPSAAAGEVFNVADSGRATKAEVVNYLAAELGRPSPSFTGVSAPGRRSRLPDRVVLNEKLRSQLGWSPRYPSFREGYAAILEA